MQVKAKESEIHALLNELRCEGPSTQIHSPVDQNNPPRLADLVKAGVIQPGDNLYIKDKPDQAAQVKDEKWVTFNGKNMTCNQWATKITERPSINIYSCVIHERTGKRLSQLRDNIK